MPARDFHSNSALEGVGARMVNAMGLAGNIFAQSISCQALCSTFSATRMLKHEAGRFIVHYEEKLMYGYFKFLMAVNVWAPAVLLEISPLNATLNEI